MRKAAMHGNRNHFGQLGRLAVCAMGRSDSARVHGGEHGSSLLLRGAALLAAQSRPNSADRFELRVQRFAGLDLAQRVKRRVRLLGKLDQLRARQGFKPFTHLGGGWDFVLHAPIIPRAVHLSTTTGIFVATFAP